MRTTITSLLALSGLLLILCTPVSANEGSLAFVGGAYHRWHRQPPH